MTPAIEIDQSQPLLVVVRFHRGSSDAEFEQYLADYIAILQRLPRFGAVFAPAPGLPMPPPRHTRWQTRFMKEYGALIEERVVGIAFALPSPLMRGVLRGILVLQQIACPHTVVGTEPEGVAWVKARLWSDHVRRMKESQS
jgi:hypothetical protein